jgi:uncharacterized protein (DUF2252 family)
MASIGPAPIKAPRPARRAEILTAARNYKMATSAHAYVRGNTTQFYEWLASVAPSSFPQGPAIWICGDCHVGNLGPLADTEGRVEMGIRDFDQTVIGNPAHDLVRLGRSLAMAARSSDLPGVVTAKMMEGMVEEYAKAFGVRASGVAPAPLSILRPMKEAKRRSWRHLADERMNGETRAFPIGKQFWPVSGEEREAIAVLFASEELQALATRLGYRSDDAGVRVMDCAYWRKGCSSLGLLRFAVLLDVGGKAAQGRDLCLFDIKEAARPRAPHYDDAGMPRDHGERVVMGACNLSPYLGERMAHARLMDKPVFVRELLPKDLKLELERVDTEEAILVARYLARVVGRAHARQLARAERKAWQAELRRNRCKAMDAPSWLWSGVVDLVAIHERAYLDHCRRYALKAA